MVFPLSHQEEAPAPEAEEPVPYASHGRHAVLAVRGNGQVRWSSPLADRLFGRRPDELRGRSVFSLFHDRDLLPVFRGFAEMVSRGAPSATWEAHLRLEDGPRRYEVAASNRLPAEGCILLVMREPAGARP